MRIVIDSDMSGDGTTIKIDGRTITEDEDITSVAFMAFSGDEPYASFSYTSRELDENGIHEVVRYSATKGDAFERAAYTPLGRTGEATAEDHLKAPRLGTRVEDSTPTPKDLRVSSAFLKEWRRMEDTRKEREKREQRIKDLNKNSGEEDDEGEPG